MGFGFLFYGFLMMIEIGIATSSEYSLSLDVFPDLAGYLFMLTAACRLELYAKGFARFKKALFPLVAVGFLIYGVSVLSLFDISPVMLENALHILQYATIILQPIAFFCLFGGIMVLASEVGLPAIASRAKLLAGVGTAYYAAQLLFIWQLRGILALRSDDRVVDLHHYDRVDDFPMLYVHLLRRGRAYHTRGCGKSVCQVL